MSQFGSNSALRGLVYALPLSIGMWLAIMALIWLAVSW